MSKEKLTIEHLAPYLPYGVKVLVDNGNGKYTDIITGIGIIDDMIFLDETGDWYYNDENDFDAKLVLCPLSGLDKLEGGINSHSINMMLVKDFGLEYGVFSHYKNELTIDIDGDSNLGYDQNISIPFMVIEAVRVELLKGHYDIFGLIEKGLAINMNEL